MSKDSDEMQCECLNEEFNSGELPHYHWRPVAEYNTDGTKIRDYTRDEQIAWIKKQKERERQ